MYKGGFTDSAGYIVEELDKEKMVVMEKINGE
jgi:hypothetical protein